MSNVGFSENPIELKSRLFSRGLSVNNSTLRSMRDRGIKAPRPQRSGASSGMDLLLSPGERVWVNAPLNSASTLSFHLNGSVGYITDASSGESYIVGFSDTPSYYGNTLRRNSRQIPYESLVQMCNDTRACIGLWNTCIYDCGFCAISTRVTSGTDELRKSVDEVEAVLREALQSSNMHVRHIMLGGGTAPDPKTTTDLIGTFVKRIRTFSDLPIYAMFVPDTDYETQLGRLAEVGVNEIAMDLEIWNQDLRRRLIPKKAEVPRSVYLRALETGVRFFGSEGTKTIFVGGIEPSEDLLEGIEYVVMVGATPIVSPFRPIKGTPMEEHLYPSESFLREVLDEGDKIARTHGQLLGPYCPDCQNNTLAPLASSDIRYKRHLDEILANS